MYKITPCFFFCLMKGGSEGGKRKLGEWVDGRAQVLLWIWQSSENSMSVHLLSFLLVTNSSPSWDGNPQWRTKYRSFKKKWIAFCKLKFIGMCSKWVISLILLELLKFSKFESLRKVKWKELMPDCSFPLFYRIVLSKQRTNESLLVVRSENEVLLLQGFVTNARVLSRFHFLEILHELNFPQTRQNFCK